MRFTKEELEAAKQADLCDVAEHLGYTVEQIGHYHTLREMDSIRIYDRSHWFRWSRQYEKGQNGGSQIDFLRVFAGMEIKEAVFWLLDFTGYRRNGDMAKLQQTVLPAEKKEWEKKPFLLPEAAGSNRHIIRYLQEERGINRTVIDSFIRLGCLYEAKHYRNLVFVGKDISGMARFAGMRGICDRKGKAFKCDVAGSDKRYGFCNRAEESDKVVVFEAAIDLMSYRTFFPNDHANMIALGMLHDAPLETMLREQPYIRKITLCLDNDSPGREAVGRIQKKYESLGYAVQDFPAGKGCKDYNEWLLQVRQEWKVQREISKEAAR